MALPGLIVGGQALQQDENNQFTNRHLAQLIAARAIAEARATEDRDRMMQGRANAGALLPALFAQQPAPQAGPVGAPFAPPTGLMPQPPEPGEASVPMQLAGPPPMGAPGGMSMAPDSMPSGAPQGAGPEDPSLAAGSSVPAAPMPVGWQPSPAAGPELGGRPSQQQMQGADSGIGAPPPMPKIPPQLLSVPNLIKAMQDRKIPPEQMVDTLHQLEPLINSENRYAIAEFKAQTDAAKAANTAYTAAINKFKAENAYRNTSSLIDTRAARVGTQADAVAGRNRLIDAKLGGGRPPASFNFTADANPDEIAIAQADARNPRPDTANAPTAAAGVGGGLTPEGLDLAAAQFRKTGTMPPLGTRNSADRQAIINRAAEQVKEAGNELGNVPADRAGFKADSTSLGFQQKQIDSIERSSVKIEKDIKTLEKYIDSGTAGSVTLVNKPINWLRKQFSDPALTEFAIAAKLVGVEYERMINGGLMSVAQLHEGAREDAKSLINEEMTPEQIRRALPVMRQEIDNAKKASYEQLDAIKGRMKTPAAGGAAPAGAPNVGDVQKGYRFKGGDPAKPASWEKVQ